MKAFWEQNGVMILQAVQNIWTFISGFINTTLNVILAIFNFIFPAIQFLVLTVWETIKGLIDGALTFIMGVVQVFAGLFTGNWSKLWEGIKNMFFGAIQFIWNYVQLFFGAKILGILGKFASKGLKFITDFASKAGSAIGKFVSNIWNKFTGMVSKVLSAIGNWVKNMVSKVDDLVYKFLGKVAKLSTDMALVMGKMWEGLKSLASKGVKMMVDAIKGLGKTFLSAGKGLLDAFKDGVMKGLNKAKDAVKKGMDKIRDFLPFSPAKKGALSDLDKSGKSFFPTFADGMLRGMAPMLRVAGQGMNDLNNELQRESSGFSLESFGMHRTQKMNMTVRHEHSGDVNVKGADGQSNKAVIDKVTDSVETNEFVSDFRRLSRCR